ncbi:MAG: glycosyltransferase family 9 protein [Chloroflexota bacterium]|nr:glycosyltransferase family 9 protein [Chloroflexota bacterium]
MIDRSALAERNRHLVAAFQTRSLKERVRGQMLQTIAALPIAQTEPGTGRILVIRPDHLGDMLLTIPALHALDAARPGRRIHALVGTWSAEVLAPIAAIDTVLTLAFPGFTRTDEPPDVLAPYLLAHKTARRLRRIGYDEAYILRRDHWWGALVAFLAGIPVRIGYDTIDVSPFLTHAHPDTRAHALIANLRLTQPIGSTIAPVGSIDYPIGDDGRMIAQALLRDHGVDPHSAYIVIHVGSGATVKNWDNEKWGGVANALAGGLDATVVLTGGARERADADHIARLLDGRGVVLAGETDLPVLAALVAEARIVLGADSGVLHLAAAVGTPTVALFGAADPDEFRPWGDPERQRVVISEIACRPCRILDWDGDDLAFHPCVRDITPRQVIDAAWRALHAPRRINPG